MKKIIILLLGVLVLTSCLESNDRINFDYELLPIDEYTVPNSFTLGEKDTVNLKYTFKNGCYSLDNVYYEYQDTARIVAISALVELDKACTEAIVQYEYNLIVTATQEEDYVFKFWKGKDSNGENIFDEVIVPVN
ncbi:hypothetical protein [Polaribacter aquimarinus]|uniref:Uncharacterized protein n=1 Tax=Polaribacter aquimarinus TaxID=2100726 RepID=A0A2U2JBW9_9FLAO|nr:hypothetical protein [Polaribacter aquimarinus]PWG05805.1 hypothetical protein DIS07_05000 [Polaribacter aquimarinus]